MLSGSFGSLYGSPSSDVPLIIGANIFAVTQAVTVLHLIGIPFFVSYTLIP